VRRTIRENKDFTKRLVGELMVSSKREEKERRLSRLTGYLSQRENRSTNSRISKEAV
jgi:hypothetical protein